LEIFDEFRKENNPNAWSNKGIDFGNLGLYEKAIECFDKRL